MNLILPVDSRVNDTQGFITLDLETGEQTEFPTQESFPFLRQGFRGGVLVENCLYVCNSFSVKAYAIEKIASKYHFSLMWQLQQPEWLVGKAANADLHALYYDKARNTLLLANSFMDSVDEISLDGQLLQRKHLWEISEHVRKLVRLRNPNAADLCHLNHISMHFGQTFLTLGNLNISGKGAVLHAESGEFVIEDLQRPHDGVFWQNEFWITETSAYRLRVYDNILHVDDFKQASYRTIDLSSCVNENNQFWCRGLYVDKNYVYLGCSQFQDRLNDMSTQPPSHILQIDKATGAIIKRFDIPGSPALRRPVLFSMLAYD